MWVSELVGWSFAGDPISSCLKLVLEAFRKRVLPVRALPENASISPAVHNGEMQ